VEQNLRLMSLTGNEPGEIVIIGIEPKEIDWGTELSPELQQKVPEIVRVILKEIDIDRNN
jgi:hydrogenase maturation protease